ncbi:MAG: hypothetical protein QOE55_5174 [Acidobacteriaceae bacterium]|nr:hypothetical protein [Acidobacteriaceae bacterium]
MAAYGPGRYKSDAISGSGSQAHGLTPGRRYRTSTLTHLRLPPKTSHKALFLPVESSQQQPLCLRYVTASEKALEAGFLRMF